MDREEIRRRIAEAERTGGRIVVPEHDVPLLQDELAKMGKGSEVKQIDRSEGDCERMAVTTAWGAEYGFGYDDTPSIHPLEQSWQAAWEQWAADRGLKWWVSDVSAPIGQRRWIASVDSLTNPGTFHAVAMEYDHLLADSNQETPYTVVRPVDVSMAKFLLPIDSPAWQQPLGRSWQLRPPSDPPAQ